MRILLIEDDDMHADYILGGMKEAGHNAIRGKDGLEGLYLATEEQFDAIIIDRMLPKLDGLAVIQAMRANGNKTPVLILSALSNVDERVKGLRAGGDDYLVKPFAFSELMARLEALARRTLEPQGEQALLKVGELEMNLLTREVKREGKPIPLQNREFRLLEFLMRRPNQVVTRTMLLENVWDFHFSPQTNLIDAQISKLRQKLDRGFAAPMLHTIRGAGYKLSA